MLDVGSLPLPFSTSAHVSCPTTLPSFSWLILLLRRKERFEADASVGYTENEALPKENSSGEAANFRKARKKDVEERPDAPDGSGTHNEILLSARVRHAKERRLRRRAVAAMSACVGEEERGRKCRQQKK